MSLNKSASVYAINIAISSYVVNRVGQGLPGLPGHPKTAEQIAVGEIADATGIARADFNRPEIRNHLASLIARYGKAAPSHAQDSRAIVTISTLYQTRPLPRAGIGINVEAIAEETGVKVYRLRSDAVERCLLLLAGSNGLVAVGREPTPNSMLLDAWAQTLRDQHRQVPVSQDGLNPYYAKIAKEAGLPPNQIAKKDLKEQVLRIAAELGLEPADSMDAQLERLRRLVDNSISAGLPMPMAPKGPAYKKLSEMLSIPKHRLELVARFKDECARWRAASGRGAGTETTR